MEDKFPCQRHDEQIKTLFKKVDATDNLSSVIHNLDKNMAVQTKMMEHVVEHNAKQDIIMEQISSNLTELNNGYKTLSKEVSEVKGEIKDVSKRVDENEEKHNIDTRDIDKDRYIKKIYKIMTPIGIGAILAFAIELFKILKG